jgi:hypothetical protein
MLRAFVRNALWLTAFALALALLTPWHAVGAAPSGPDPLASPAGSEHRTDCPLFAARKQAAPAEGRRAWPTQPDAGAGIAPPAVAHFRSMTRCMARPSVASRAARVASPPLYLVNLRLLR